MMRATRRRATILLHWLVTLALILMMSDGGGSCLPVLALRRSGWCSA